MKLGPYLIVLTLILASCAGKFSIQKRRYNGGLYFAYSKPLKVAEKSVTNKKNERQAETAGNRQEVAKVMAPGTDDSEKAAKQPVIQKVKEQAKHPQRCGHCNKRKLKIGSTKSYFGVNQNTSVNVPENETQAESSVEKSAMPKGSKLVVMLLLLSILAVATVLFVILALISGSAVASGFIAVAGVLFLLTLLLTFKMLGS